MIFNCQSLLQLAKSSFFGKEKKKKKTEDAVWDRMYLQFVEWWRAWFSQREWESDEETTLENKEWR